MLCALPVFGGGRTIFGVLLIVFGALLLLCGIILLLLLAKSIRTAKRLQLVNEYAFYQDRFTVHTLRGEEDLGTGEFVYTELYKVKEKHGLLQIYASSNIVYPVETAALAPEDLRFFAACSACRKNKPDQTHARPAIPRGAPFFAACFLCRSAACLSAATGGFFTPRRCRRAQIFRRRTALYRTAAARE